MRHGHGVKAVTLRHRYRQTVCVQGVNSELILYRFQGVHSTHSWLGDPAMVAGRLQARPHAQKNQVEASRHQQQHPWQGKGVPHMLDHSPAEDTVARHE